MNKGKISQVIGAVVDIQFPESKVPEIYNALIVNKGKEDVVFEVQQQLGQGLVRAVAMASTDGLQRGMEVVDTGAPISVPVGEEVLGRLFNVLGENVDGKAPIKTKASWPIHRDAPSYDEQSTTSEIFETGIKVIDLIAPFVKGGKVHVGEIYLPMEYVTNDARKHLPSLGRRADTTLEFLGKHKVILYWKHDTACSLNPHLTEISDDTLRAAAGYYLNRYKHMENA